MSDFDKKLAEKTELLEAKVVSGVRKVKRSLAARISRGMAWTLIGIVVLVMVLVGGFWWYSTTVSLSVKPSRPVLVHGRTDNTRVCASLCSLNAPRFSHRNRNSSSGSERMLSKCVLS